MQPDLASLPWAQLCRFCCYPATSGCLMVLFEEIGEVGRHFRNKWCTHLKGYSLSRIFLTKLERIGFGFGFFNVLEMNI